MHRRYDAHAITRCDPCIDVFIHLDALITL